MTRRGEILAALVPLTITGCLAFYQFALADDWTYAVLFGLVLPVTAVLDWKAQYTLGDEAGRAANRWLMIVSFALLAASL
jgi:hypothetical protein